MKIVVVFFTTFVIRYITSAICNLVDALFLQLYSKITLKDKVKISYFFFKNSIFSKHQLSYNCIITVQLFLKFSLSFYCLQSFLLYKLSEVSTNLSRNFRFVASFHFTRPNETQSRNSRPAPLTPQADYYRSIMIGFSRPTNSKILQSEIVSARVPFYLMHGKLCPVNAAI